MKLHDLVPNPGSKKNRKRVGRGISAGQGKTAGRGTKGEGARRGKGGSLYRQGGQLPFYRSLPFKRGFTNIRRINYAEVNVDRLGDFPAGTELDPTVLGKGDLPVALLGRGNIKQALTIKVHKASQTAIEKVEKAGGTVVILE